MSDAANRPVSLAGKTAVVTGATSGLGLETASALASMGANVVLAGRSERRGREAVGRIRRESRNVEAVFESLDLADLADVAAFAGRVGARHPIDILVNNAGVMAIPTRYETKDGFEMQFGTNHLGHFALTGHLLPNLARAKARVVNLSSLAHRMGRINFDDLQSTQGYSPWKSYGQSKLATLIFAFELQRRSVADGWGVTSYAAHPGGSSTGLNHTGPVMGRDGPSLTTRLIDLVIPIIGQSASDGAGPSISAAVDPGLTPGAYLGPDGFFEMRGRPAPAKVAPAAKDNQVAARLWAVSEALTHVTYQETMNG